MSVNVKALQNAQPPISHTPAAHKCLETVDNLF